MPGTSFNTAFDASSDFSPWSFFIASGSFSS